MNSKEKADLDRHITGNHGEDSVHPDPVGCDQCEVATICGTACHETGCPNSWKSPITGKGYPAPCWECGCNFIPEERPHKYSVCQGCIEGMEFDHEDSYQSSETIDPN